MDSRVSATHRCLLVNEIFRLIAEDLFRTGNMRALVALAQTCKGMHQAVLPVLWQQMPSLAPLLRLFPKPGWSEILIRKSKFERRIVIDVSNPEILDWTRVEMHAPHIRAFLWWSADDVYEGAVSALSAHRPASLPALLPNLRKLYWREHRPRLFPYVQMFLTSTLRVMCVETVERDNPAGLVALYARMAEVCHELEELHVYRDVEQKHCQLGAPCNPGLNQAMSEFFRRAKGLRKYVGDVFLSKECFEVLAGLPQLSVFSGPMMHDQLEKVAASIKDRINDQETWFGSLMELALNVSRLDENTQAVVGAVKSSELAQLKHLVMQPPDTRTIQAHFEAISRAPYRSSLTCLDLIINTRDDFPRPTIDLAHALRPLYALTQIKHFYVSGPLLMLSGTALSDIAEAWPALENLVVVGGPLVKPLDPAHCPRLTDLVHLARKCVRLHTLELHVNAEEVPSEETVEQLIGAEQSVCPLRTFIAHNAPISNPESVQVFLERLFPKLEEVDHGEMDAFPEDTQRTYGTAWKKVDGIRRRRRYRF
ncbi:hypothetical protein BN946_scf185008.g129 [Trametes cinnabarina]|uniref:F-box domain-containing protein n=1 Tax=Pycnoporus cinnabarinus TaxID=5643 RepID=A0A060SGS1_PYCCI|nr:hypothetical protein BN946_scf185008.g129 [Trametes cinnabarina]